MGRGLSKKLPQDVTADEQQVVGTYSIAVAAGLIACKV